MKTILLITLSFLLTIPVFAQIYVDASKSTPGNGQSWATAYNNLSVALNNAAEGAEIWVAEGVYIPDGNARTCQFTIDKNLRLYGGFRGDEEFIWERGDYREYPTILSGDRLGNDIPGNFNVNKNDNCRHVIFITEDIDNSTVIDGFFIQGGHTDDILSSQLNRGGGGVLSFGAPIIRNCTITGNYGAIGGGINVVLGGSNDFKIINCLIYDNLASFGGGISIENSQNIQVRECTFKSNNTIIDNRVSFSGRGSAIEIFESEQVKLDRNVFIRNKSEELGSVLFSTDSYVIMSNSLIFENSSPISNSPPGGTIAKSVTGSNEIQSKFINNTLYNNVGWSAGLILVFAGNATPNSSIEVDMGNNIFYNTNYSDFGTADYSGGNNGEFNFNSIGGNLSINNQQQLDHSTDQINVSDPIFVNPEARDFSLIPGSPAIGAGVSGADVPFDDIRGQFRPDPPSSGAYDVIQECIHMPASCICFDYTLMVDDQLSASMPCGENVRWYINDQVRGNAGSQFNFDLSSGFGSEVTFCIKQNTSDPDYRCCVTLYLNSSTNCDFAKMPNAHFIVESELPFTTYNGETADNNCAQQWNGIKTVDSLSSIICNYFNDKSIKLIDFNIQNPPYVYHYPNCFTVSNNLGYSRYCVDDFTFGSDFPKVNPTFDWDSLKLTIEMDEDFPSFPVGSAIFLDPGDGTGLRELEDFIAEGTFEYEFESSGTYLVKLYVNHPTLANYTISWSIVPIPASCDGGEISLSSNELLDEECYSSGLTISNREPASCSDCGSGNPNLSYQWQRSIGNENNWNIIPGADNASFSIDEIPTEITFYRRIVTFSWDGGERCEAISNVVRVNPRPDEPNAGLDNQEICEGEDIPELRVNVGQGITVDWYDSNTGGNPLVQGSLSFTPNNPGTFYAESRNSETGCVSDSRTALQLIINPRPANPNLEVDCTEGEGNGVITIISPIGDNLEYSIENGIFQDSLEFKNLDNGDYSVIVRNTQNDCVSEATNISLDCGCDQAPSINLSSNTGSLCGYEDSITIQNNEFDNAIIQEIDHNGNGQLDHSELSESPFSFTYKPIMEDLGKIVEIMVTTNNPEGPPCQPGVAEFQLSINQIPTVSVSTNGPYCEGDTIRLMGIGDMDYEWFWQGPNDFTSEGQELNITEANQAMNGDYIVFATDTIIGCSGTDTVNIIVNENPDIEIASTGPFCEGQPIELFASGGDAFQWSGPDGFSSEKDNPVIENSTTDMEGEYTVVVSNENCSSISSIEINVYSAQRNFEVPNPCPNQFHPAFWNSNDLITATENVLLQDEGFILLENQDEVIEISFDENFTIDNDNELECTFSKNITISPASTPNLGDNHPTIWTSVFVQNETDTLVLYEIQGLPDGGLNLQWGALMYNDVNSVFKDVDLQEQGSFFIRDSREAGVVFCDIRTNEPTDCPLRIYAQPLTAELLAELRSTSEEGWVPEQPDLLLYPNPGSQQLNIALRSAPSAEMKLTVWDSRGKLVHRERVAGTADSGDFLHTLSAEAWPAGLYLVRITGIDGEVFVADEKWIKF